MLLTRIYTESLPVEDYLDLSEALRQIAHSLADWAIVAEGDATVRRHLKRAVHETECARAQLCRLQVKGARYK